MCSCKELQPQCQVFEICYWFVKMWGCGLYLCCFWEAVDKTSQTLMDEQGMPCQKLLSLQGQIFLLSPFSYRKYSFHVTAVYCCLDLVEETSQAGER